MENDKSKLRETKKIIRREEGLNALIGTTIKFRTNQLFTVCIYRYKLKLV